MSETAAEPITPEASDPAEPILASSKVSMGLRPARARTGNCPTSEYLGHAIRTWR
jgi:hypothetical protein